MRKLWFRVTWDCPSLPIGWVSGPVSDIKAWLKGEMKRNFEQMERFSQELSDSRQKWQEQMSAQTRKNLGSSMLRRTPRPLLTQTGSVAEKGTVYGRTGGNFPRMLQHQQQGLFTGNLPRPAVIASFPAVPTSGSGQTFSPISISSRTSASSKVARVLPSRPLRTLRPGPAATATATNNFDYFARASHSVKGQVTMEPVKKEIFDVFSLDSDSDEE